MDIATDKSYCVKCNRLTEHCNLYMAADEVLMPLWIEAGRPGELIDWIDNHGWMCSECCKQLTNGGTK